MNHSPNGKGDTPLYTLPIRRLWRSGHVPQNESGYSPINALVITCREVNRCHCGRTQDDDDGYCSVAQSGERDMIAVRDGLETSFPIIVRYCGDVDDVTVTSSGDTLLVEFDSDGRLEGPGFAAHYSFTESRLLQQPQTAANDELWDHIAFDRQPTKRPNNEGKYLQLYSSSYNCLLYTSPSPRDRTRSRMPSSA